MDNEIKTVRGKRFLNDGGNWIPLDPIGDSAGERDNWCVCDMEGVIVRLSECRRDTVAAHTVLESMLEDNKDLDCFRINYVEYADAMENRREAILNSTPTIEGGPEGKPAQYPVDKYYLAGKRNVRARIRAGKIERKKNDGTWTEVKSNGG